MDNHEIPIWWEVVSLSEVSNKLVDGSHNPPAKQSVGFPMLSAVNINNNQILFSEYRLVSEEAFSLEDRRTRIEPGDVLLTIVGAIGRTAVVSETTPKFTLQRSVAVITPRHISSKFLMYQFESPRITQYFQKNARGTAQKGVYLKTLGNTEIWLPPLNEQHRIVAKIEALFSELDKGIENFKTAREQLKIYRQALLKHAFSGKLTEQWRAENAGKLESAEALLQRIETERQQRYQQQLKDWEQSKSPPTPLLQRGESGPSTGKENAAAATTPSITTDAVIPPFEKGGLGGISKPKPPKTLPPLTAEELVELPDLPAGWTWCRLGNTNVDVSDGPFGSNLKSSDYVENGVRVIRLENIGALEFIEDKESFVSEEKYELLKNHTVTSGDIVFSSFITENVRVALVPPSISKAINKADCFCVRVFGERLINHYAVMFLSTRQVFKQLEDQIHGVGRPRINTTQLKEVTIPICGAEEQKVIVAELESRLSEVDQLDQTLTTGLQQAEALRQSILKKAFSGQLVPQDPNDESASVLLERIRAEKSGSDKPKSRKTKHA